MSNEIWGVTNLREIGGFLQIRYLKISMAANRESFYNKDISLPFKSRRPAVSEGVQARLR